MIETKFAGLTLSNPIIIGSSGLTNTAEKNRELEKAGAGALVLKSLFEEQISNEAASILDMETHPEAADYVATYFKENEVSNYLHLIRETKEKCTIPVIASINCYTADSWIEFAHQIEAAGADALELNIFSLNAEINPGEQTLDDICLDITRKLAGIVRIPIVVKLSKYFSRLVNLVNQLDHAGASGVVLFNRFYQPDIDIHTMQMNSGSVFSSHSDISDTLRWTGIVSGRLPQVSLVASTGIHDWEDIVKAILTGASAVEIVSTVYQHGNEMISQMVRSMEEWMTSMNFASIEDFRGKMNYAQINDPTRYERFQFMKYFSNRD
ncbi:dihydroorotate dehydrogenase-like protein [Bacteroidales bacterium OttesenSCG-928-L03]|nr:dihydroorotate dehydrogenase-like protein [Bacteroidales bacterium OttesenSCG-928-L03]MDL2241472.1 dihydroorotate dehydrogenase-like protein [Bacteroidales bacterium OttesenSCG-928-L03]